MQLKFKSIDIEGFRSIIGPVLFQFASDGLFLVKGDNGAGKTTVFESLVWCLYGENLKGTVQNKVKPWEEITPPNFNGTRVTTQFHIDKVEYIVTRHLAHKEGKDSLELIVGGNVRPYEDKDDLQRQINEILGMDHRVFVNSFLFGQRMAKLVSTSNVEKRKLFEDLFDMSWITELKTKVDADLTEAKNDSRNLEDRLSTREGYLKDLEADLAEAEQTRIDKELEIKERIGKLTAEIGSAEINIKENKKALKAKQVWAVTVNLGYELDKQIEEKDKELLKLDAEIASMEKDVETCKESIKLMEDSLETLSEERIKEIRGQIEALRASEAELVSKYGLKVEDDIDDLEREYEALRNDIDSCEKEILFLEKDIESARKQLLDVKDNPICTKCGQKLPDVDKTVLEYEKKVQDLEAEMEKVDQDLEDYTNKYNTHLYLRYLEWNEIIDDINRLESSIPKDAENKIKNLKAQIKEKERMIKALDKGIVEGNTQAELLEESIKELGQTIKEKYAPIRESYQDAQDIIEDLKESIASEESIIKDLERSIKELPEKLEPYKDSIKRAEEKIETAKEDVKELAASYEKAKEKVVGIEWWSKKALASNGIKAYVFKAMLEQLNQYTDKYGSKLGVSIKFSLDLTKVSTPFSTICSVGDRVNKDYKEFSGGQQQRLDIVLMFAMHDLLSSIGNPMSIMILDEALDGLDVQGESDVFDLIREKSESQAVYVITHSQVLDTLHTKAVNVVSNNGVTEIQ